MSFFRLLGTSSCEGIPAPFCSCALCSLARRSGGKEIRRRFSVLIGNELLIDFGPDVISAFREYRLDETEVKHICFTHSHEDHFFPLDLMWRIVYDAPHLNLVGNKRVKNAYFKNAAYAHRNHVSAIRNNVDFIDAVPGREIAFDGYTVLPIRASHGSSGECALNYLVTVSGKWKIFIISDTGWWRSESFESVKDVNADAAVIEISCGIHPGKDVKKMHHLGAKAAIEFIDTLKAQNSLKKDAVCVASHISHVPGTTHSDLEKYFAGSGIVPGYDGMQVDF